MNTTHRSIWNVALGAWVAVSEITRARGKRSAGAVTLALACSSVGAQNINIDNASQTVPGTYTSPWNITGTLTVGDASQGTLTVGSNATVSNNNAVLGQSAGAIGNATVTGAGATWTSSFDFYVGYSGTGTLNVQDGGKVSNGNGHLGLNAGGLGNATVTGLGSIWTNSGGLDVGYNGTGTLTVQDGGAVSNTVGIIGNVLGSTGNATVTDAGSTWTNSGELYIGSAGTGTLTVSEGGAVSNTTGIIGNGSIGNATVTGAGAIWTNSSQLRVGNSGTGTLTVSNGGAVSNTIGYIGYTPGSTGNATVTGANSTWTNSNSLVVGNSGNGTLTVSDGGTVSNTGGVLGFNIGGIGNAAVTGADATWTNSVLLRVGYFGTGTLTVANGGHVSVNNGTGVIDVAQFAGSTGVLNIGAAAGSAAQAAGTVAAGELRFGAGTGSLNFNHTDAAYAFGTRITGAGVLNHYAGTTLLTGANTYTGATTVSGGTLRVNGSIANSNVTVNSGGTLGGSGTVGNTTIAAGGVLAPGNSIGLLTVSGNATFAGGSVYRVELDADGTTDRSHVTGAAALNGTVDVQASAGTYAANTTYTILNAAGGLTGNFAGVRSSLAFLTPALAYDANNVFLSLVRNTTTFSSVAITPNQIATSTALQNTGNSGDLGTVQTALTGLSAAQARAAYDSASGAGIVALRHAGMGFATSFGSQLQARLGAQANAANGFANSFTSRPVLLAANDHLSDLMAPVSDSAPQKFSLAGGAALLSSSPDAPSKGFWIRGNGAYGNTDSDSNAAASRLRSSGLSVGFDAEVKDGVRIGVAATAGTSHLSTDNNESGKARSSALAAYGSYVTGSWNFSGSASMGWGKNHLDRNVVVGALNRVASSDFDSNTLAAYGEASYAIAMNGWTLQPLAGLSLSRDKADGFTETGAGALSLQVAGQTITSTKSFLGAKASFEAGRLRIEPRVIWSHEFGDLNTPMTAQFQGAATASPFQVSGAALKRDTLILGLGASGSISKGMDFFADVQAEQNSAQRTLAVLVGLRSRW
jgi:outer membrane autotransporter protein